MTRIERLKALMDDYNQSPDDYDADCEEDVQPFFDGEKECGAWCCVTKHDGKNFFYPTFDHRLQAQERACEYILDDLYEEIPVAVVNLDTGEKYEAEFESVRWTLAA